jgi:HAD superfamily hydrolase (TIGR01509 family)
VEAAYPLGLPEVILAHLLGRSLREGEGDLYYRRLRTAKIRPYPGVREALAAMCGRWPSGVFTGSSQAAATISISIAGLADLLPVVVGGDQVNRPKPAPDGILMACRRLGQPPADVAYVGDSPTDLLAARAAGTVAVAASWGYLYSAEAAADFTLTSPGQVHDLLT